MKAVVSLLDDSAYSRIEAMWRVLELKCGLKGIKNTPYPHFSWHVADSYSGEEVQGILQGLSANAKPFTVTTSGLGIFTGQEPVIYILISKTEKLLRFHKSIWKQIQPFANCGSDFYTPDVWVPHITLAHSDVNKQALLCALEELAFVPFSWEIKIENLAVVGQSGVEVGRLINRFDFPQRTKQSTREPSSL